MATGVNYCSTYEPNYKVSERVWADEHVWSDEEGGGRVTWETQAMEVKGQVISAPEPFTCPDRKQRERMAELQERRRSLQALLSARLAELRRICLQEAELTGAVPSDFPLEAGEKPPCVRRRGGTSRHANRKCRSEDEDSQRSKSRKTLFSAALRKHSDSEQNNLPQTHTHYGKRTVHRGCHTDDMVKSESSSTSDSTGHDNDDGVSHCRPLLATTGSPVEVFYQSKTRRNSLHTRNDLPETLPAHRPLPLPPPPLPPRSLESSSSSGPSEPGLARHSNSSDGILDRIHHHHHHHGSEEEAGGVIKPMGGSWLNGQGSGSRGTSTTGLFRSSETLTDGRTKTTNGLPDGGGVGRGRGGVRGAGYSEVLLDYVWGKQQQQQQQQQLQQRQGGSRQPITAHQQLLYNGYAPQQGVPPTGRAHQANQRIKVTRTKSCGPFLPVQSGQADGQPPPLSTIQPDPHPHLLPPRPPQQAPPQDGQLEEATRSLHKALALEGLRDWYLRNTIGSSNQSQTNGKVNAGVSTKANGSGVKCQATVGGGVPARRRTLGAVQQSSFQTDSSHHQAPPHQAPPLRKPALPHSATFHGHPLHSGRSMEYAPQKQEVTLRDLNLEPPSPGTLV